MLGDLDIEVSTYFANLKRCHDSINSVFGWIFTGGNGFILYFLEIMYQPVGRHYVAALSGFIYYKFYNFYL